MNRRQMLMTSAVATAAAAGGAGWAWWRTRSAPALSDAEQSLWTQRFDQPGGGELSMASLRGKPLVLNFWATWCAPCVKEMPMLDSFHREHQAQGWQVLGLAVDGPTPVREFLTRVPVSFPIGLAGFTGVDLAKSLGNERGGLPFSAVFDRQGTVVFRKLGTVTPEDLSAWVKKLS